MNFETVLIIVSWVFLLAVIIQSYLIPSLWKKEVDCRLAKSEVRMPFLGTILAEPFANIFSK